MAPPPLPSAALFSSGRAAAAGAAPFRAALSYMEGLRGARASGLAGRPAGRTGSQRRAAGGGGFGSRPTLAKSPEVTGSVQFERPLGVCRYPDPRLRAVNKRIANFDGSIKELAAEMMRVMYEDDGVGLAAPQVGVNVQMMVFNPEGRPGRGQEYVLCNPRVVKTGRKREVDEEGCLSFPDVRGDVERYAAIQVNAQDADGKDVTLTLKDPWLARIFQHEFDHLDGVLFHDRMDERWRQKNAEPLQRLVDEYRDAGEPNGGAAL